MARLTLVLASIALWGCTDPCRTAEPCSKDGLCTSRGDTCVAREDTDCAASEVCKKEGKCAAFGKCIAKTDDGCAQSEACRVEGRCTATESACVAATMAACAASEGCSKLGRCSQWGDVCVIGGDEDCHKSEGCRARGECALEKEAPRFGMENEAPTWRECVRLRESDGNMGCPCGCDRSEAMAAELEEERGEIAMGTIDETLETIAKREAGGYITEAMVQHRLRMLEVEAGLGRVVLASPDARFSNAAAVPEGELATDEDAAVRVRTQLYVHGETTEFVHGREKALHAMFRLWLEIENLGDRDLTLSMPTIDSRVPFPISRWYLAGSAGLAWDGSLQARETVRVHVIGYLGEPVAPGTQVDATVQLRSMEIPVTTRARERWYEPYED